MERRLTNRAGIAALLTIVWGALMFLTLKYPNPYIYPNPHIFNHDINSPVLALELSRDSMDFKEVVHGSESNAKDATPSLQFNNWLDLVFIPLYSFFLWSVARVFANRTRLVALLVIGTAVFNYLEDWRIARALGGKAATIFIPSLIKWGLLGLVLFATGVILLRSTIPVYSIATKRLLAMAYFISSLLLLLSVALGTQIGYSLIELGSALFTFVVAIHLVGFLGPYLAVPAITQKFVENFCEERKKPGRGPLTAVRPEIIE